MPESWGRRGAQAGWTGERKCEPNALASRDLGRSGSAAPQQLVCRPHEAAPTPSQALYSILHPLHCTLASPQLRQAPPSARPSAPHPLPAPRSPPSIPAALPATSRCTSSAPAAVGSRAERHEGRHHERCQRLRHPARPCHRPGRQQGEWDAGQQAAGRARPWPELASHARARAPAPPPVASAATLTHHRLPLSLSPPSSAAGRQHA